MAVRTRASVIAATAIAVVLLATPTAANADTIYPPSGACTTTPPTATPNGEISFGCAAGTFGANERITITVTGENGSAATIGMVRFAITTASGFTQSRSDGSMPDVEITLPSNASGIYNIAAVSPTSAGGTAAVSTTSEDNLPVTGLDSGALLGLWIGGGALVAAGAALAIAAVMRRRRDAD